MTEQAHFLQREKQSVIVTRSDREASVEPLQLGQRVREIRQSKNLTLEEASKLTGLARSTLSKIENEQISPTFAAVTKLVTGLGIDIPQLFTQPSSRPAASGRRAVTRKGKGQLHPTTTYEHELLAEELSGKRMIPYRTTVFCPVF